MPFKSNTVTFITQICAHAQMGETVDAGFHLTLASFPLASLLPFPLTTSMNALRVKAKITGSYLFINLIPTIEEYVIFQLLYCKKQSKNSLLGSLLSTEYHAKSHLNLFLPTRFQILVFLLKWSQNV